MDIESEFDVYIPYKETKQITTVESLVHFVNEHTKIILAQTPHCCHPLTSKQQT